MRLVAFQAIPVLERLVQLSSLEFRLILVAIGTQFLGRFLREVRIGAPV